MWGRWNSLCAHAQTKVTGTSSGAGRWRRAASEARVVLREPQQMAPARCEPAEAAAPDLLALPSCQGACCFVSKLNLENLVKIKNLIKFRGIFIKIKHPSLQSVQLDLQM